MYRSCFFQSTKVFRLCTIRAKWLADNQQTTKPVLYELILGLSLELGWSYVYNILWEHCEVFEWTVQLRIEKLVNQIIRFGNNGKFI